MVKNTQPTRTLNAYELYQGLINSFQNLAKYCGLDIYRDDFKVSWPIIACCGLMVCAVIDFSYVSTMNIRGDPEDFFVSVAFIGCCAQLFVKVCHTLANLNSVQQCHEVVLEITRVSIEGEPGKIISRANVFYRKFAGSIYVMNAFTILIFCLYPPYAYLNYGQQYFIVNLRIPFIDDKTIIGYATTLLYQFIQVTNIGVIYAIVDTLFFYFLFFAGAFTELLAYDCKLLNDALLESENIPDRLTNHTIQEKIHSLLVKTIKRSQEMDDFFEKLRFFESSLLAQFACLSYTLMTCLLVLKFTEWFAIYPFSFVVIFLIAMFSTVGTYIEMKFDRLPDVVYEISWYLLTPSDQKMFIIFLQHVQQSKQLYILGKRTLNVETGVAIFKFIYSAYVMLDSFY